MNLTAWRPIAEYWDVSIDRFYCTAVTYAW